ncbi:cytochrome c oxidase assembly protein [Sphaerisporangium rhizosphaerae]|uniref:Cytochrome c oxidase assembly protein n=1 Tax=Sphaerisporangium rhizosphaerae TaxID=2269375 RepID=A0ABW2PAK0_9ACTN
MASPRRSIVVVTTAVTVAALAVLFAALVSGGGWPPQQIPGLPSPGPLTTAGLPVVRVLLDVCAVATVGTLFAATALTGDPGERRAVTRAAGPWALGWALTAALTQILTMSDLLGLPIGQALESGFLTTYSMEVPQGQAFLLVMLLAVVVAVGSTLRLGSRAGVLLLAVALFAVLPPAYVGHSASAADHNIAVSSLMAHIGGVTLWVGGLFALVAHLRRSRATGAARVVAVRRFSAVALCCFVVVGFSGLVNAWIRLGGAAQFWETRYGLLVLAKIAALGVLGWFGWTHRRGTIAALEAEPGGERSVAARSVAEQADGEQPDAEQLDAEQTDGEKADGERSDGERSDGEQAPAGGRFLRLATAEVGVMACTIALAVGLSRTPPPRADAPHGQHELLGYSLPPFSPWRLLSETRPDPLLILAVAGVAAAYLVGVWRLNRRGEGWPAGRTAAALAGVLVLLYGVAGGVSAYGPALFSVHALQYALVGTVGPALLALGAPLVPFREAAPLLGRGVNGPVATALTHPAAATAVYAAPYFVLYVTGLFDQAQSSLAVRLTAMAVMALSGTWFFSVALGLDPLPRAIGAAARVRMLAGALVVQVWTALLFLAGPPQGPDWYAALAISWAPDRAADQSAGALLGAGPAAVTIALLIVLMTAWRRRAGRRLASQDAPPQTHATRP